LTAVDSNGRRRIDDPQDFVRLETASALRREIPVVPVLVQGARMPSADQLPPDLADLAYRNAVELTHARWDSDLQVLVTALRKLVGQDGIGPPAAAATAHRPATPVATPAPGAPQPLVAGGAAPARSKTLQIALGLGAAALVTGGVVVYQNNQEQQRQQATALAAAQAQATAQAQAEAEARLRAQQAETAQAQRTAASAAEQLALAAAEKDRQLAEANARLQGAEAARKQAEAVAAAEVKIAQARAAETRAADDKVAEADAMRHPAADLRRVAEIIIGDGNGNRLGTYSRLADGGWGEFDLTGKRNFRFRELSRDEASVHLWDDSRQVGVQLDLRARLINYRGSSQEPYRRLYRIMAVR